MNPHYDCIVVGAGIVGLTTVLALAQKDLRVALIEAGPLTFDYDLTHYDLKVSAITRASERIFKNLSIWDSISKERSAAYQAMKVWEEKGEGNIEFSADKISQPNLGYIIENRLIRKSLYQKLLNNSNVKIYNPCKCQDFYHHDDKMVLQLEGYEEIETSLLIGADGANSWVRNHAEFELEEKSYNHHAVVATIETEQPHAAVARQRFLRDGILAFLPLSSEHTHSIVWSTTPEKAQRLVTMDETEFNQALTEAFSGALGKAEVKSKRVSFPLFMRHVKKYVKPRIALLGDAAHTVHPLAGQGVNLGLLDAAVLCEVLVDTHNKKRDIGLLQHLRKYERRRKGDNQRMLLAMAGFKNLFGNEHAAVVWARNMGLNLTNKAEPVKNLFIKKALGLSGDLPNLAMPPLDSHCSVEK